ncbi:hypothetical protein [Microbacterium phyllosphaerae]|uniref:hypothetical protein n=1 Tax=Microbacterium phyllosphaerae TaxID=124798 RepID=UPI0021674DB7|nr:hypothetical protein [Microbacterium phyllosphaerae]MCS3444120.1 hypothetical protein [Microbacterium phyllosphaerae]
MAGPETMMQTEIVLDGQSFLLAQVQDLHDLKRRIEAAVKSTGTFVDFVVVGNREVSVLITPHSRVIISVSTVLFDERDTGDVDFPFGGYYDGF